MTLRPTLPLTAAGLLCAAAAAAQEPEGPPRGFVFSGEALFATQPSANLDGGGSFTVDRWFAEAGGLAFLGPDTAAGLFVGGGSLSYGFGDPVFAPWGDITTTEVSALFRFPGSDRVSVFIAPSARLDYESGADQDDALTYGVFVGAAWEINERLTIGPAFGAFTELEESGLSLFPALLIDWDITDRLNLSTGPTIAATEGPGLSLNYAMTDEITLGLAARSESAQFRLDDDGIAPGGVGEDESFPMVVTFDYELYPGTGVSAFAGVELGGSLRIKDSSGNLIEERDYDPAPIFGAAVRLAF